MTTQLVGATRLEVLRGDITQEHADAIVNAANSGLLGGGGVDGAIHRAGGPAIIEACRAIRAARGPLPPGEAVITTGGMLPAHFVIHTVGPIWAGGTSGEAETLARCYANSLALAAQYGLRTIAFPSIATGAYGYPIAQAARVALRATRATLLAGTRMELVRWVLFSDADLAAYAQAVAALLASPSD